MIEDRGVPTPVPQAVLAPLTESAIFLTFHSYSNSVMWPFDSTKEIPTDKRLPVLGQALGKKSGYQAYQGCDMYLNGGDDEECPGDGDLQAVEVRPVTVRGVQQTAHGDGHRQDDQAEVRPRAPRHRSSRSRPPAAECPAPSSAPAGRSRRAPRSPCR